MKRLLFLVVVLTAAAAYAATRDLDVSGSIKALNGQPTYLGVIAATTSKTNASTAVPFTIIGGSLLLIQCDASAHVLAASTVTTATGVKVAADEKFYLLLKKAQTTVAVIDAANCSFWTVE